MYVIRTQKSHNRITIITNLQTGKLKLKEIEEFTPGQTSGNN